MGGACLAMTMRKTDCIITYWLLVKLRSEIMTSFKIQCIMGIMNRRSELYQ